MAAVDVDREHEVSAASHLSGDFSQPGCSAGNENCGDRGETPRSTVKAADVSEERAFRPGPLQKR